mmetsp:Transcript_10543/g.39063  ORF Transcript_10543/g.39063 Transcript_10543/m.39063 type:complete len:434 (+) Transcript_10543:1564-2865(+)
MHARTLLRGDALFVATRNASLLALPFLLLNARFHFLPFFFFFFPPAPSSFFGSTSPPPVPSFCCSASPPPVFVTASSMMAEISSSTSRVFSTTTASSCSRSASSGDPCETGSGSDDSTTLGDPCGFGFTGSNDSTKTSSRVSPPSYPGRGVFGLLSDSKDPPWTVPAATFLKKSLPAKDDLDGVVSICGTGLGSFFGADDSAVCFAASSLAKIISSFAGDKTLLNGEVENKPLPAEAASSALFGAVFVCSFAVVFAGDPPRLAGNATNAAPAAAAPSSFPFAGESPFCGAGAAYLATASPELAAPRTSLCASMAVASVIPIPPRASVFGTHRLQNSDLSSPALTYETSESFTPHSKHLKHPLWYDSPTSTDSIGYTVFAHRGHLFVTSPCLNFAANAETEVACSSLFAPSAFTESPLFPASPPPPSFTPNASP